MQQGERGLGHGRKTVGGNIVRDAEAVARQAVEEVAGNRLARRKADGVHQAIEVFPMLRQVAEDGADLFIAGHVAVEYQFAAKFGGKFRDAFLEALAHIGEGEGRAFTVASLGDAVGDGAVRQQARDEDFFALQESHDDSCLGWWAGKADVQPAATAELWRPVRCANTTQAISDALLPGCCRRRAGCAVSPGKLARLALCRPWRRGAVPWRPVPDGPLPAAWWRCRRFLA